MWFLAMCDFYCALKKPKKKHTQRIFKFFPSKEFDLYFNSMIFPGLPNMLVIVRSQYSNKKESSQNILTPFLLDPNQIEQFK